MIRSCDTFTAGLLRTISNLQHAKYINRDLYIYRKNPVYQKNPINISKEPHTYQKKNLQKRPVYIYQKRLIENTHERDLQKRPTISTKKWYRGVPLRHDKYAKRDLYIYIERDLHTRATQETYKREMLSGHTKWVSFISIFQKRRVKDFTQEAHRREMLSGHIY